MLPVRMIAFIIFIERNGARVAIGAVMPAGRKAAYLGEQNDDGK